MQATDEGGHFRGHHLPPGAKSHALFAAALGAALLGLTLLDVAPPRAAHHAKAGVPADAADADCIVAAAIFAGVSAGERTSLP